MDATPDSQTVSIVSFSSRLADFSLAVKCRATAYMTPHAIIEYTTEESVEPVLIDAKKWVSRNRVPTAATEALTVMYVTEKPPKDSPLRFAFRMDAYSASSDKNVRRPDRCHALLRKSPDNTPATSMPGILMMASTTALRLKPKDCESEVDMKNIDDT